MNYGEIVFDMNKLEHPTGSRSDYLLKRWTKYTIYAKSGSYNKTDNPLENLYSTSSVYLYDYVAVSKEWYDSAIYTASVADTTPAAMADEVSPNLWMHYAGTFKNSPNAKTNNYQLRYNPLASAFGTSGILPERARYGYIPLPPSPANTPEYTILMKTPVYSDKGEYFEIVGSYPRNHITHKRPLFSLYSLATYGKDVDVITSGSYLRCRQTINTTIGPDGLEDGSSPVQTIEVGNLNLIQSDNVINK